MKVFGSNISCRVSSFLNDTLKAFASFEKANKKIYDVFGIIHFFENNDELEVLKRSVSFSENIVEEPDRAEYGDFQTNADLAHNIALRLVAKKSSPQIIVEPTCGKGSFIIASLRNFKNIEKIFGVEIYKPYVWETKFNIINFFLENPDSNKPEISITHGNVFEFDFKNIAEQFLTKEILIIGNPPWVTNSTLGTLNSTNLPQKSNFKNHSGLDAMTGKGNFDIAEFIALMMFETFQHNDGYLLFLVKNSVIKNIVFDQKINKYNIANIEKHCIKSKKEFNVSVEAALFYCELNANPSFDCKEYNFYENDAAYLTFGWLENMFVSNILTYINTKKIDGKSPFIWRQGLKHDCSAIMELEKVNGHYVNGLDEEILLENGLVYGILKSSDLKNRVIDQTRKFTIVTQKKVGQETIYIKKEYPQTYQYLTRHQDSFDARKSSIYNNKPLFSIFGIGDYSFKPYKVAISSLYKTYYFTLILPQDNKPVMLDDTCYFIGFDTIEFALYSLMLLNSKITMLFLQSVTFSDAKRVFTKDVLMRINLLEVAMTFSKKELQTELQILNEKYQLHVTLNLWDSYIEAMTPVNNGQIAMFV